MTVKDYVGEGSSTIKCVLPSLLPFDHLLALELDSPRFWPLKLDLQDTEIQENLRRCRVIYVKRKTGYLLYEQDPKGMQSIMSRSFPKSQNMYVDQQSVQRKQTEFVESFSGDSNMLAFAQEFCHENSQAGKFCTRWP